MSLLCSLVLTASHTPVPIERVSLANDGTEGNGRSFGAAVNANGRFVVFYSEASNLVVLDTNGTADFFVRDTCRGAPPDCQPSTLRVSVSNEGTQANGQSLFPATISTDGRFVAFGSLATNLVIGDTNGALDVFVRDTCRAAPPGCTPSTIRVSVASDGTQLNQGGSVGGISADGRFVIFSSGADSLVPNDGNGASDVFVRDTCVGAAGCVPSTTLVSASTTGTTGNGGSFSGDISANGRYVVFESTANNLVPNFFPGNIINVYVRDTCIGAAPGCFPFTSPVSVTPGNPTAGGNNSSNAPAISADGRYVVFQSHATNLVPVDTNAAIDVFLRDTCLGVTNCAPSTVLVSVDSSGTQANMGGSDPGISGDGRFVAFDSLANNLVPGDVIGPFGDVFVRDTCQGAVGCSPTTIRISLTVDGMQPTGSSGSPAFTADGTAVAFSSDAANLVPNDSNGAFDVFLVSNPPVAAIHPGINSGGVVNAASSTPGAAVAAGSIVSVFGTDLAATTEAAGTVPLPTTLGGATMQFDASWPAPKFFASPSQINIQIPWEVAGQGQSFLTDNVEGLSSNPEPVNLLGHAPGLFTTNQQGFGQGAILIANTSMLAAPMGMFLGSRPAIRGVDFLEIYCTGLGAVTNQPATGAAASANPLSATTTTPMVTIGGVPATVLFSGLAPPFVGLYVVTLQVPNGAPAGNSVPVVLTIGGAQSNTVTIAVQ